MQESIAEQIQQIMELENLEEACTWDSFFSHIYRSFFSAIDQIRGQMFFILFIKGRLLLIIIIHLSCRDGDKQQRQTMRWKGFLVLNSFPRISCRRKFGNLLAQRIPWLHIVWHYNIEQCMPIPLSFDFANPCCSQRTLNFSLKRVMRASKDNQSRLI